MDIRYISGPVNAAAASVNDCFDWGPGSPRGIICDFFTRARGGIDRSRLQVEGGIRWRELRADSQRAPLGWGCRRRARRDSGAFGLASQGPEGMNGECERGHPGVTGGRAQRGLVRGGEGGRHLWQWGDVGPAVPILGPIFMPPRRHPQPHSTPISAFWFRPPASPNHLNRSTIRQDILRLSCARCEMTASSMSLPLKSDRSSWTICLMNGATSLVWTAVAWRAYAPRHATHLSCAW